MVSKRWQEAVEEIRRSGDLRESILRSVMSSMALSMGHEMDRAVSERLFEEALNGPELTIDLTPGPPGL